MLKFPFKDFSNFTMDITLNKTIFIFKFRWNPSAGKWYMDLYTSNKTPLLLNKMLRANNELLSKYQYDKRFPRGKLFVTRHDGKAGIILQKDFINQKAFIAFSEE